MAYVTSSLNTCACKPPAFQVSVRNAFVVVWDLTEVPTGRVVICTGRYQECGRQTPL